MDEPEVVEVLGIDAGGTFTDYYALTQSGGLKRGKVSSTPENPENAVKKILQKLTLSDQCRFVHGTTVGTNALLEKDLKQTVLVTNSGLEGLLQVGRGTRPKLYELNPDPSEVSPFDQDVLSVDIRDHPYGENHVSLAGDSTEKLNDEIEELSPAVVVICLVHSYRNPSSEKKIKHALSDVEAEVICSSDILPKFREYERASTTVVNGGLIPIVSSYLDSLRDIDYLPADHYIMGSDRGVLTFEQASKKPALTVLSGPAGGVLGTKTQLEEENCEKFISMDMGGTSTDVTAVTGSVPLTDDHEVGGYPILFPMVDVHTIGSGGGSIIRLDDAEGLRIGPESAGADPGPACYGNGGPATLTDAQLILGRIPEQRPIAGELRLYKDLSKKSLKRVGKQIGMSAKQVALGALDIAVTKLEEAIRSITIREGMNPANFSLIAHGGAGGLFAADVAEELNIDTIYLPRYGGVLSAAGLAGAPQFTQQSISPLEVLSPPQKVPGLNELLEKSPGWATQNTSTRFKGDCRFRGQTHTLGIEFSNRDISTKSLIEKFKSSYRNTFGYIPEESDVVLVNLNAYWKKEFTRKVDTHVNKSSSQLLEDQNLITNDGELKASVHQLESIQTAVEGPCLLSGSTTTVYLPPAWKVTSTKPKLVKVSR